MTDSTHVELDRLTDEQRDETLAADLEREASAQAATWIDEREEGLNAEVHQLLDEAADAIDLPGPRACIEATLKIVEQLREKLIAERAAALRVKPAHETRSV